METANTSSLPATQVAQTVSPASAEERRRPRIAVMANCLTPYRVHLHNCLVDELPEVELNTLITHGRGDFDFQEYDPPKFETTIFSEPGDSANNNLLRAPHLLLRERRKARRIIDYLRDNQIDALIGLIPSYYSYYLVYRACRQLNIKVFVRSDANIHNERNASKLKKTIKKWWYNRWMPCVTGVMPMGELGEQFFRQYWQRSGDMYRVPYWPNLALFTQRDEQLIKAFRKRHALDPQRRRLVYCGRLIPVKRVDLLIDAFAALADERPEWDLVIMGAGALEEKLRDRVPGPLRDRVAWTGFLESDELIAGYHASDVLVLPSDREPWALVVPEALAAGLPVISSDVVGAAHEMITPGENGETFVAGDPAGMVDAIAKITAPGRLEDYQSRAKSSVFAWMERSKPVDGIRQALIDANLLPGE